MEPFVGSVEQLKEIRYYAAKISGDPQEDPQTRALAAAKVAEIDAELERGAR